MVISNIRTLVITKTIYQMKRLNFMRKLCLLNCWSLVL